MPRMSACSITFSCPVPNEETLESDLSKLSSAH
uniref:Uncharacterized protein n=1 Tax=Arundo donax TaxID=35708 RepID=A0A0A8YPU3_ARUDO